MMSVAIAEHIAKDESYFHQTHEPKGPELGMTDTEFHSVQVPPGRGQHFDRSTARDY